MYNPAHTDLLRRRAILTKHIFYAIFKGAFWAHGATVNVCRVASGEKDDVTAQLAEDSLFTIAHATTSTHTYTSSLPTRDQKRYIRETI